MSSINAITFLCLLLAANHHQVASFLPSALRLPFNIPSQAKASSLSPSQSRENNRFAVRGGLYGVVPTATTYQTSAKIYDFEKSDSIFSEAKVRDQEGEAMQEARVRQLRMLA
jgi:hypothetical protein